jgi:Fur family ferric uptake transcriptional regulator
MIGAVVFKNREQPQISTRFDRCHRGIQLCRWYNNAGGAVTIAPLLDSLMNIRHTRQKDAIRKAFTEADRPLSLEEALAAAQQHHRGLGIATVYRNLKSLVEDRWLTTVEIPGEPPRYEIAGKQHHHHFHCNDCGKLYELEGCVDQINTRLPRGFHATGHEFFLYGICASCTPKRSRARA